ncbi:MAG: glycosyltransferase, partial [Muribaculaceae bacterium]|nr:glycosyltransferase [Muribaculaceae bacterium]
MISPKVSVIIPVYNALSYLRDSVESVRRQSLHDIEIILVNDGSRDGSGAECEALARLDSRITVLHKSNSGAGLSRSEGLLLARGEYVAFLDADDLMMPGALEKMYFSARKLNLDMLHARREIFSDTPPEPLN